MDREGLLVNTNTSNLNNRMSVTVIEIKDDPTVLEERSDHERHSSGSGSGTGGVSSSSRISMKDVVFKKDEQQLTRQGREREREREREQREREREHRSLQQQQQIHLIDDSTDGIETRSKRDKRREDRYRNDSPNLDIAVFDGLINKLSYERDSRGNDYDRSERIRDRDRDRDRDLSSVSNDSNGSLHQQRRSQDIVDYERGKQKIINLL